MPGRSYGGIFDRMRRSRKRSRDNGSSRSQRTVPQHRKPVLLKGKEELVFVNYRDIRDLNPHLYAGEMYAQEMLYETLVNITADG